MTPAFMGSEPVHADAGKYAGTTVMQDEQNKGLALMLALTPEQQKKATLQPEKTANNSLAQAFRDNLVLDYAGLRAQELTAAADVSSSTASSASTSATCPKGTPRSGWRKCGST